VQATVRTFDPATHSGTVLLDDGLELPFDGAAFAAGGLRHVRVGQRVRLRTESSPGTPKITALTLVTLPLPD
jgi:cold shock CspA family protein